MSTIEEISIFFEKGRNNIKTNVFNGWLKIFQISIIWNKLNSKKNFFLKNKNSNSCYGNHCHGNHCQSDHHGNENRQQ